MLVWASPLLGHLWGKVGSALWPLGCVRQLTGLSRTLGGIQSVLSTICVAGLSSRWFVSFYCILLDGYDGGGAPSEDPIFARWSKRKGRQCANVTRLGGQQHAPVAARTNVRAAATGTSCILMVSMTVRTLALRSPHNPATKIKIQECGGGRERSDGPESREKTETPRCSIQGVAGNDWRYSVVFSTKVKHIAAYRWGEPYGWVIVA